MNTNSAITDFEYIRNEMRGVRWADMLDDEEYLEYHDNESLVKDDKVVSFPKPVVLPSLKQEEEERLKNLIEEPVQAVNLLPMSCPWLGKKNETITPVIVLEKPIIVDNPIIEVVSVEVTDKRSRACKSVSSGEKCLKGDKCTFAHSVDELNPVACKFVMSCKFIFSDTKTCFYIHPEETKEM